MSRREFHFSEGTSNKFWAITLKGTSFAVQWGRAGTQGQEQTKEFASDAEAKKQADKLVAEKLKKGYVEQGRSDAAHSSGAATASAPAVPKAMVKAAKKVTTPSESIPEAAASTPNVAIAPPPVIKVNLEVDRSIALEPGDLAAVAWRKHSSVPRPPVRAFDSKICARQMAGVKTGTYGWEWDWSLAGIPHSMSPEEAHFWLSAMTQATRDTNPKELAAKLGAEQFQAIDGEEALALLSKRKTSLTGEVLLPLNSLLPLRRLVEILSETLPRGHSGHVASHPWQLDPEMVYGFGEYILPYLSAAQRDELRAIVTPLVNPVNWPTDHSARPSAAFFIAAMLGMSDLLLPVVQSWKEGFYNESGWDHTHYHQPQVIVLGLGSPQIVEAEMRRLKLPLNSAQYIRSWLATTEYAALDYARDCILAITNREDCEKLLQAFCRVKAPEAAPHMLQLKLTSKAPKVAREWLDSNIGCAVAGLIPVTAVRGALADAAIEHLRELKKAGYGDLIRQAAGANPPDRLRKEVLDQVEKQFTAFDSKTTPDWLISALKDVAKPAKLPAWLKPQSLPLLTMGDQRLSDEQVMSVLGALQKNPFDAPGALLLAIRQHASAESRDAFAWRLFEAWSAEGSPSKDKWAMGAIGHLGADNSVLKLTPMIRNWPGESQHQRAVFGLDCLRAVGTDTALMQLNGIAQKLKFKGLKTKAMEFMDAIAAQRNMSRTELEDRIVPDCDLDERGTRIFDFGPRQFRFVLGPDMKAMIKDADGKVKSDLPVPGAKDDAAKSKDAVEQWKLLKKQIREVAKIQAERLEQAMVTGRRWTDDEFEKLLVQHPLMINFVRLVVWGGYGQDRTLKATFRVTDDQTYADSQDEETELADIARVGIVHPLHLSDEQKRAWGQVLSDYEIVPPFEQIGRPLYALEKSELSATGIERWKDIKIPATALVGTLERLAWIRGQPQDAGIFYEHSKGFPGANVTAIVEYENGVPVGYMEGWEDQKLTKCHFLQGLFKPNQHGWKTQAMPLSEVDPIAVSEVIKDLMLVASKGK